VIAEALLVLTQAATTPQVARSELQQCIAQSESLAEVVECERRFSGALGQPPTGDDQPAVSQVAYQAMWLTACTSASPEQPGRAPATCAAARTCPDTTSLLMNLWLREIRNAEGAPVDGSWTIDHMECRPPSDAGQVRRQVGWVDVVDAVRRVGIPPGDIHAPRFTLVNLETTFYTRPHRIDRVLRILGYAVDVEIHPSRYTWHWGDGTTQTTTTPGRPYPSHDVTHTYRHATDTNHDLALSVDVTYTGRYRVDGNAWTAIPQPITISGPPTALPVKQASAVLVTDD
jgi:hypothetical protein